ncbi:quinate 5-dehydrogenase [Halanaerobaculum tunisiense]
MKHVVSISLGSSRRDHQVRYKLLGEEFILERIGTDGDLEEASDLFSQLDGQVDAFGLGGIDLNIYAGAKKYQLRTAKKLIRQIEKTPIVDGSGLKNTLERKAIKQVAEEINLTDKKVLIVSALDRFGMAEAIAKEDAELIIGDLIFGLGLPWAIKSLSTFYKIAKLLLPVISQLPFRLLYPTGDKQLKRKDKFSQYYRQADVIAGDFHYIKRYLPVDLKGKIIITNTITDQDINLLQQRGVAKLITTTPEFKGRSFGTNILEAALVSLLDKPLTEIEVSDYLNLLRQIDFRPRIEELNQRDLSEGGIR